MRIVCGDWSLRSGVSEGRSRLERYYVSLNFQPSLDSEDDIRSGCRNVSHYQQSYSGLPSPRQSNSIEERLSLSQLIERLGFKSDNPVVCKLLSISLPRSLGTGSGLIAVFSPNTDTRQGIMSPKMGGKVDYCYCLKHFHEVSFLGK